MAIVRSMMICDQLYRSQYHRMRARTRYERDHLNRTMTTQPATIGHWSRRIAQLVATLKKQCVPVFPQTQWYSPQESAIRLVNGPESSGIRLAFRTLGPSIFSWIHRGFRL